MNQPTSSVLGSATPAAVGHYDGRSTEAARIAITLGDPRGVGPEVVDKAVARFLGEDPQAHLVCIGAKELDTGRVPYRAVGTWDGSESSAGSVALAAICTASRMALSGEVGALVTAPVHKPALRAANARFAGHTELLQEISSAPAVGMLMAAESTNFSSPLRVLLATTHLALRDVSEALTAPLLVEQVSLLHKALRLDWNIERPRIAVCALNPHASDSGLFGDEEKRVYLPALRELTVRGEPASGPFPADTVFVRALKGEFDAVVAPYHDVGMAAFKTVTFGAGVNVTLGLPFVRTSPDHGTAFDIAGEGLADESSTLEALRLAARLTAGRSARTAPAATSKSL